MEFIDLFSGIGGFSLGLERSGMECVAQVEIDPFCNQVLEKHWPDVPRFGDIRDVGKHNLPTAELICGGFPCQPFSNAGKRRGKKDDRYIWPEMFRVVSELKPKWFIGENVSNIVNMALDTVLSDLEGEGYSWEAFIIPACAVNAPHRRDRVWIVAYSESRKPRQQKAGNGRQSSGGRSEDVANANGERLQVAPRREQSSIPGQAGTFQGGELGGRDAKIGNWWAVEPDVGRVANGVPRRVDRLRSLGNAVVPQVVEFIGRAIMKADGEQ